MTARRIDRSVLPIPDGASGNPSAVDAREQQPGYPPSAAVTAPPGAPNVVIVLIDDMGFGASSAFGGPCRMPTAERLADDGLRYSRFHTTSVCSPTRAALLTGRNHHAVGMGHVVDFATEAPGYTARMPRSAATIARVLTENGFATGAFGKMHQTPRADTTPVGPFRHWPTVGGGFERFYGFIGGESSHWAPALWDGTTPVEAAGDDDEYHLSEDLVDHAITWVRDARQLSPEKPFFCYLPFGATHAPYHVDRRWVEPYRGRFDAGWDDVREATLRRQQALGVVPADAVLAPWAPGVPRWADTDEPERRAMAALMEVYAGFAEHTDAQVGRFVDALTDIGELDNTLFLYMLGDHGAAGEGGLTGSANEYAGWNGFPEGPEEVLADVDRLGGPDTWPVYSAGWSVAMNTPFAQMKELASHYGGTRTGMIVHWPERIADPGGIRNQWHHVVDVVPTILECAEVPAPALVDGIQQQPIAGTSFAYTFDDPEAAERHHTQYFEVGGSRGIYHRGWMACVAHRSEPWNYDEDLPAFPDDRWELYDTTTDWTQAHDVAAQHPERLRQLQDLFLIEAARNQVLPLDDRGWGERGFGDSADPLRMMTFHPGTRRVPSDAMPRILGVSHAVTAQVDVDARCDGVLAAQGGKFAGWSLYCRRGILTYCQALGPRSRAYVRAEEKLELGRHEVRVEVIRGSGAAADGERDVRLLVDGVSAGQGQLARTVANLFTIGEDFHVGVDPFTPVSEEYPQRENAFSGSIAWVRVDLL